MKTIANAISKCAQGSLGEIMQLMDVVEIKCVPRQGDVANCGVHVVLNCMSILTHMADGPGVGSWVPPSKASREEEIPPYRQQLTAECTELKSNKSKKQKTTAISVKSPKKKNKKGKTAAAAEQQQQSSSS
jgi:hypothetical protein